MHRSQSLSILTAARDFASQELQAFADTDAPGEQFFDWINNGRAITPEPDVDGEEVAKEKAIVAGRERRALQLLGSTSLPALPKLQPRKLVRPTTADIVAKAEAEARAAAPPPEPPIFVRRKPKTPKTPKTPQVPPGAAGSSSAPAAGAPAGLSNARSKRMARMAMGDAVGLDTTHQWAYAGKLNTMSDVGNISRRALARHRQLRQALQQTLDEERVPTPQFAARRELPPRDRLPVAPPPEEALTSALKYWAPSGAVEKCPSFMFHEPGMQVRESLAILEELRWPGGRKRLQARHADEMEAAQQRWKVEEEKKLANDSASKVQRGWRSRGKGEEGGSAEGT